MGPLGEGIASGHAVDVADVTRSEFISLACASGAHVARADVLRWGVKRASPEFPLEDLGQAALDRGGQREVASCRGRTLATTRRSCDLRIVAEDPIDSVAQLRLKANIDRAIPKGPRRQQQQIHSFAGRVHRQNQQARRDGLLSAPSPRRAFLSRVRRTCNREFTVSRLSPMHKHVGGARAHGGMLAGALCGDGPLRRR